MKTTVFVPLSGRGALWSGLSGFLGNLDIDKKSCQLCLLDTSHDKTFGDDVQVWLAGGQGYGWHEYHTMTVSSRKQLADLPRNRHFAEVNRVMVSIYKHAQQTAIGDEILIIEDDMLPTTDVYRRLKQSLQPDVFGVSVAYKVRGYDRWVLWRDLQKPCDVEPGQGVEQVQATGFGCLLMKTADFQSIPMEWQNRRTADPAWPWGYDMEFFKRVGDTGRKVLVDWTIPCQHLDTPRK